MFEGRLHAIYVTPEVAGKARSVDAVRAVEGRGLEGDRYFERQGSFFKPPYEEREVTLIEIEAIDALARDHSLTLDPGDSRRNLVTRGVALNHLVGRDFTVGEVVLRGRRLCEPCSHLAKLTSKEIMRALVHRGGLRAQIVRGGILRLGDAVRSQPQ